MRKSGSGLVLFVLVTTALPTWAIEQFSPPSTTATVPSLTLRLLGDGFLPGETFRFEPPGGVPTSVPAMYINSQEVRLTIPGSLLTTAGTAFVQLFEADGTSDDPVPYTINPPPLIDLSILPQGALPDGTRGAPYAFQNRATGGTPPLRWSVTGSLPANLTITATTGLISGVPQASGTFNFKLILTDAADVSNTVDLRLIVNVPSGPLIITTTSPLPGAKRGVPYATNLLASGGSPPYSWSIISGALSGLTLAASTGVLSGTPAAGNVTFTARVTDSLSAVATRDYGLSVTLPSVSCEVSPRNSFLASHQPRNHLGALPLYPDHSIGVLVTAEQSLIAGATVTLAASQNAFGPAGSLPNASTSTASTGQSGLARFVINPQQTSSHDQTDFVASGTYVTVPFTCQGSVVTGMGATLGPLTTLVSGAATTALLRQVNDEVMAFYVNFKSEFGALRSADRALAARLDRVMETLLPSLQEGVKGAIPRPPNPRDVADMAWILQRVKKNATPAMLPSIQALRKMLDANFTTAGAQQRPAPAFSLASNRSPAAYGQLPVEFEANTGQSESQVRFLARTPAYGIYLGARQAYFVDPRTSSFEVAPFAIPMEFSGVNTKVQPEALLAGVSHYLRGPNPSQWQTNVQHYGRVRYSNAYPGVDVVFHSNQQSVEFDFEVAPQANPANIRLRFPGAQRLQLTASGALNVIQGDGAMQLHAPVVYQQIAGVRVEATGAFVVGRNNEISFRLGRYDHSQLLIIDPVVEYASYLGGSKGDVAAGIALDAQGNTYLTGGTLSADFPLAKTTAGSIASLVDAFVTKLDPSGKLIYSTYFGGSDNESGLGIAVDAQGNAYVTGLTRSPNFPRVNAPQAKCTTGLQGDATDAFVAKLDPTGSNLLYSTCVGGSGIEVGRGIAVAADGSAHITGFTTSNDFPVKNAYQNVISPPDKASQLDFLGTDAFVTKLNPAGNDFTYSTYLGGIGGDMGMAIGVDSGGDAWVTGVTYAADFPMRNALQAAKRGPSDAFLARLNPSGNTLLYSTFLGGSGDDMALGMAIDAASNIYLTGTTSSADYPLAGAVKTKLGDPQQLLGLDAFATKLTDLGTRIAYSTYLGGAGLDMGLAIAVATDGSAYVVGGTSSTDFPAVGLLPPAAQSGEDAFLAKLSPDGSAIRFSGTFGGTQDDSATAIAVDTAGNAFITGLSKSPDLLATYGATQPNSGGQTDSIVLRISSADGLPGMRIISAASYSGVAVSPGSIATAGGQGLTSATATAATPVTPLGGATLRVKDAAGVEREAKLYFVSPGQINFIVPEDAQTGLAEVTVLDAGIAKAKGTIRIANVAPGFFSANASGQGTAAALYTVVRGATQSTNLTYQCGATPGSCTGIPLGVSGFADSVYVSLYGTGIAKRTALSAVTATAAGINIPVQYAGPQTQYAGLDQLNLGPLPATLAGKGIVDVIVTVDGEVANTVTLTIQ
ncbi:MAG: SBBP repeat-containing protein [Acidobacteriota bacterium]